MSPKQYAQGILSKRPVLKISRLVCPYRYCITYFYFPKKQSLWGFIPIAPRQANSALRPKTLEALKLPIEGYQNAFYFRVGLLSALLSRFICSRWI